MPDRPEAAVPSGRPHLVGLDGLRGVAAIVVVAGHAGVQIGLGVVTHFYLAVDFFLVLSGYVVARAYDRRLGSGDLRFRRFARLRIVRLHPLLLLGTALSLLFLAQHHLRGLPGPAPGEVAVAAITGLLCIPWHPLPPPAPGAIAALFPLDDPAWSLYVEFALNFAYALVAARLGTRTLAGLVLAGAIGLAGLVGWYGTMSGGALLGQGGIALLRGVYPFFAGVLILRLERAGRLPALALPWWLSAAVLAAVLAWPVKAVTPWVELPAILLLWPAIVVFTRHDRFGRRLRTVLSWAGAVSYPVYILHVPIIQPVAHLALALSGSLKPLAVVAEVLLMLLVGQLALRFYDIPLRTWLTRRPPPAAGS